MRYNRCVNFYDPCYCGLCCGLVRGTAQSPIGSEFLRLYPSCWPAFWTVKKNKGLVLPFEAGTEKFIIFSDMHKGARNGADDFSVSERAYITALEYYNRAGFVFIEVGDSKEL